MTDGDFIEGKLFGLKRYDAKKTTSRGDKMVSAVLIDENGEYNAKAWKESYENCLGVKEGDEVIVPTWTFAATAQVVEWIGAKLILCDIDAQSLNIDVDKAEKLITDKTKVIMPVHIAGYPCDMEKIASLAKKYNLKVVEDAAHAIGTKYNGIKIGNFSDLTCFSFYATKI